MWRVGLKREMQPFLLCDKPRFLSGDDLYVHSAGGGNILRFRGL